MRHRVMLTSLLASAFVVARVASAQATYELLHRFQEQGPTGPVGRLAEAPDGSLFGMTYGGGRLGAGTIFALRPSTVGQWSAEVVHDFRVGPEGGFPWGSLIAARDGNFYGLTTTNQSPTPDARGGTVFRMTPSGDFSLLHTLLEPGPGQHAGVASSGGQRRQLLWIHLRRLLQHRLQDHPDRLVHGPLQVVSPSPAYPLRLGVCPVTELWEGSDGFLYGQATYAGPYNPVINGGGTLFRIDPRDSALQSALPSSMLSAARTALNRWAGWSRARVALSTGRRIRPVRSARG